MCDFQVVFRSKQQFPIWLLRSTDYTDKSVLFRDLSVQSVFQTMAVNPIWEIAVL